MCKGGRGEGGRQREERRGGFFSPPAFSPLPSAPLFAGREKGKEQGPGCAWCVCAREERAEPGLGNNSPGGGGGGGGGGGEQRAADRLFIRNVIACQDLRLRALRQFQDTNTINIKGAFAEKSATPAGAPLKRQCSVPGALRRRSLLLLPRPRAAAATAGGKAALDSPTSFTTFLRVIIAVRRSPLPPFRRFPAALSRQREMWGAKFDPGGATLDCPCWSLPE